MSEESPVLECGHRNDLVHLISTLAGNLLMRGNFPDAIRNSLLHEFDDSIKLAFKKSGVENAEINGEKLFNEIKTERMQVLMAEYASLTRPVADV